MAPMVLPLSLPSSSSSTSATSKFKQKLLHPTSSSQLRNHQQHLNEVQEELQEHAQMSGPPNSPLPPLDLTNIIKPTAHFLAQDFAYPAFHPLHLTPTPSDEPESPHSPVEASTSSSSGPHPPSPTLTTQHLPQDGPPWEEDPYLSSPIVSTAAGGEREYYFSVASADDEIYGRAIALFDFSPENDNEVALREGQEIWISYRHGQGWLVAQDPVTNESGLVPEEYVHIFQRDAFSSPEAVAASSAAASDDSKPATDRPPVEEHETTRSRRKPATTGIYRTGDDEEEGWEDVET
ncbi:hypothetical protein V1512DRAFT_266749 [Lipomyces arxii]|uniref:uncharacterized protein n=1 Tax=Lipomyces arxii TaxID=56418 RepID=UPI0034CE4572